MAKQISFEERLKKLEAQNGHTPRVNAPSPQGIDGSGADVPRELSPSARGRSGGGGFGKAILGTLVVFFIAMVGLAAFTFHQAGGLTTFAAMETAAELEGQPPAPDEPGFFAKLIGGPLAPYGFAGSESRPMFYLPQPGDGWMRITQDDAARPDIADEIRANWPAGAVAIRDHPGYDNLNRFLKAYRVQDMEQKVLSKKRARAIYIHPNGEFMWVKLEFLDNVRALGSNDAADEWLITLAERLEKKAQRGEIAERVTIGSVTGVNLTRPSREGALMRSVNAGGKTPGRMRLSIPLGHRVTIDFQGHMAPARITTFMETMPQADYEALLN